MAKRTSKKKTSKKKTTTKKKTSRSASSGESAAGKRLVIVESPAKARTINRYLGSDYLVKASVGHIRDLPSKNPKGVKAPVPGVDLEHEFRPTYEVLPGKSKTVTELKRAAKQASEIWFATDLDREGEAIAWHLAELLGVEPRRPSAWSSTRSPSDEIQRAFSHPHPIDMDKVNAQQARRILDRIVGYQVSPLLWKKVARGLSAGRVQSVAVRLVVEREREIVRSCPTSPGDDRPLRAGHGRRLQARRCLAASFIVEKDDKGKGPTVKAQNAWLAEHKALRGRARRSWRASHSRSRNPGRKMPPRATSRRTCRDRDARRA
jgi:DNA topoisomerase-1